MKFFTTLIVCLWLTQTVLAQSTKFNDQQDQMAKHIQKPDTIDHRSMKNRWIIGTGVNAVNDSRYKGDGNTDFSNYFDPSVWDFNLLTLYVDYAVSPGFYINSMISRNTNKESDRRIFATDINLKYTFINLLPADYWLAPYLSGGVGYTLRNSSKNNRFNVNFGLGTYFWLNDNWGINLQAMGKLTVKRDIYNYKQNTLGVVYKL